ncbi:3-hydroxybutyrate dehydrogenase [Pontibacillus halophilus JSM 076056 = DSM 19796]|uniref:3-hydroxybutyrate dehydrogenase n=1 Tax=Pontibacillus halophilus JSM 076056 = DSM 19796 TaxID=1385510 RepID=A0A0A5GDL7_9BACI|nr:3-hydroxybutyrate dehydrogenase [Pontibacillus halophilus]KGX91311.1 3-hydroxybutyrate dehydrogenase [Pontibacillus halophilus JSM 076056 = DSM 19796]
MVENRVALVTGSASGIGLDIAQKYADEGAKVVITDLNEEKTKEVAASLREKGHDAIGLKCDVSNEEDVKAAIDQTIEHYGRLDILVNNAGLQHVANLEEFPTEKYQQMINIMLVGPFMATKYAIPHMRNQGFGRIINMASINGLIGFSGKAAYNSAKHGVIGLTKVSALETADQGITVNALCPGYVDTPLVQGQLEDIATTRGITKDQVFEEVIFPLVPQKRLIQTEEIADYALFLSSDKAKGVTGQAVVLDGGYTAQ